VEWDEHEDGQTTVIRLRGEVDLQHSPALRQLLRSKAQLRVSALLLDISEVRYIDSSGLATLVEYYQQSRGFKGRLVLAGATPRVKSVFVLVRLHEIFEFYATVHDAKSSLLRKSL
jgi:anti-sigma B factor antagonist